MTTETPAADIAGLTPCPFCGSKAERYTIGEEEPTNTGGDVIVCTRCQASSHVEFGRKENLESRWNTRTTDAEITRLRAEAAELRRKLDEQTLVVQAIRLVTATAQDPVRGLQRIMALTRVAGVAEQYSELRKRPFVAKAADLNASITTIREMTSTRGEPQS